jgi:hypothetical protein
MLEKKEIVLLLKEYTKRYQDLFIKNSQLYRQLLDSGKDTSPQYEEQMQTLNLYTGYINAFMTVLQVPSGTDIETIE